jgi:L-2-hydroxycarboxylate dehydrogenase (NAD+)
MSNRYQFDDLLNFSTAVFEHEGVPSNEARKAANALMWASVRGVDTHGIRNLKRYYIDGIRNGAIRATCQLDVERSTPVATATNARSSLGLVAATDGMQIAIEKAKASGVGLVSIQQSQHFGAAGVYAHLAAEQDMIGLAMTGYFFQNGQSRAVLPFGGALPMFSTNPLAFACPCEGQPPFVLDMATSVVPVNRLELMHERGAEIPSGWGLDAEGNSTTIPEEFDSVLPLGGMEQLGGHKGFGLMMMVQILTGVLSSAWKQLDESDAPASDATVTEASPGQEDRQESGERRMPLQPVAGKSKQPVESRGSLVLGDDPQPRYGYAQEGVGQFLAAIRIDQFMEVAQFKQSMSTMIRCINESPTAKGVEKVQVAGQPEAATMQERLKNGVPLEPSAFRDLETLATETGIAMPKTIG